MNKIESFELGFSSYSRSNFLEELLAILFAKNTMRILKIRQ